MRATFACLFSLICFPENKLAIDLLMSMLLAAGACTHIH